MIIAIRNVVIFFSFLVILVDIIDEIILYVAKIKLFNKEAQINAFVCN